MSTFIRKPSAAQVRALDAAAKEMGITRLGVAGDLEQLAGALSEGELPEMALMVEYKGHRECLTVATNRHLVLLVPKLFSKKRDIKLLPYDQLTDVSWKPGMANHRITLHMGKRQEVIHCSWLAGQDRGRELVERLRSYIPQAAHTTVASPQASKARALEEFVYHLDSVTKSGVGKVDFEHLAGVLEADEMPQRMVSAAYDPLAGYNSRFRLEANADLKPGALLATGYRLVFVHKPTFGQAQTISIDYDTITDVTFTTGRMFGSVSAWVEESEQKFDKIDQGKVAGWVRHIQQGAGITPDQPGAATAASAHTVESFLRRLDKPVRDALLQVADPQQLAALMEPAEAVEHMWPTVYTDDYLLEVHQLPGVAVWTDRRLIYFSTSMGGQPYVGSFTYSSIGSIDHTRGRFMGSIIIGSEGVTATFDALLDGEVEELAQCIQERAGIEE